MAARTVAVKKTAARKTTMAKKTTSRRESAVELHAYVPDLSVYQNYVARKVWGVQDKTLAEIAMRDARNILLSGDTGAGKTLFGEAFASFYRFFYYSLPCDVSIDPSALFGRMQPTDTAGKFRWQDGPITQIVRHGGVLNISEINFMTPKIAASLYPLLDGRRYLPLLGHEGEVVRAHLGKDKCWCDEANCNKKRVLIIADMNPNYRGTMELNAAFKNRFEFKIPWNYDPEVEKKLVHYPTLRTIAAKLREMYGSEIRTPVSTNMLMEFETFYASNELGTEFAIQNFVSAFGSDEKEAVAKVFEVNAKNLENDKRSIQKNGIVDDDDVEDIEFEQEQE